MRHALVSRLTYLLPGPLLRGLADHLTTSTGGPPLYGRCPGHLQAATLYLRDQWADLSEAARREQLDRFAGWCPSAGARCDCELLTDLLLPALAALDAA